MSAQISVDPKIPQQVLQVQRERASLVLNVGNTTVYVGDDSTVGEFNGIPLSPGYGISWDADIPMFAVADSIGGALSVTQLRGTTFKGM